MNVLEVDVCVHVPEGCPVKYVCSLSLWFSLFCCPHEKLQPLLQIPQVCWEIGWNSLIDGVPSHRWEFLSNIYYLWLQVGPKGSTEQTSFTEESRGQLMPLTLISKVLHSGGNCNMSWAVLGVPAWDWLAFSREAKSAKWSKVKESEAKSCSKSA